MYISKFIQIVNPESIFPYVGPTSYVFFVVQYLIGWLYLLVPFVAEHLANKT